MKEEAKKRWQKIRARGKGRYLFLHRVVLYALTPLIAKAIVQLYYLIVNGTFEQLFKDKLELEITAFCFGILGFAAAREHWETMESLSRRDQEKFD